jgi:hypothetical protein
MRTSRNYALSLDQILDQPRNTLPDRRKDIGIDPGVFRHRVFPVVQQRDDFL